MKELLSFADIVVRAAPDVSQPLTFTTTTNSVNMENYDSVLACLLITDAATGCVVTMKQGTTATANTALTFVKYYYKADIATNVFVEGAATSSTFTTGVASATGLYVIPITGAMLTDTYKFIRLNAASTANATGALFYIPYNARFPSDPTDLVDSIS